MKNLNIVPSLEEITSAKTTADPIWSELNALSVFVTGDNSATYAETAEFARDFCERHEGNNVDAVAFLADLFELAEKQWFILEV